MRSLIVREMQIDIDFKAGDEFKSEVFVITDVKPGFGEFDALLFADSHGDAQVRNSERPRLIQRKVVRSDVACYLIDPLDVVNTKFFCVAPHDLFRWRVVDAIRLHRSVVGDDDVAVLPGDFRVVVEDDPLRSPIDLRHVLLTDMESALDQEFGHSARLGDAVGATWYG
jgi:hypothetical protein